MMSSRDAHASGGAGPGGFLAEAHPGRGHVGGCQPEIQTNISKEAFEKREPC
jgi:hypothetical protein